MRTLPISCLYLFKVSSICSHFKLLQIFKIWPRRNWPRSYPDMVQLVRTIGNSLSMVGRVRVHLLSRFVSERGEVTISKNW